MHAQVQLVSENITGDTINALNVINPEEKFSLGDKVNNISNELFDVNIDLQNVSEKNLFDFEAFDSIHLIIGINLIEKFLVSSLFPIRQISFNI